MESLFERKEEMKTLIFLLSFILINIALMFYVMDKRIKFLEEGYKKTVNLLDMIVEDLEKK